MARYAIFLIVGFWLAALAGFWPTYFTRLGEITPGQHFHGLVVFGWYLLLLLQATLIQTGNRSLHRALGKISFGYVPLLAIATLMALHSFLGLGENPPEPYFLAVFSLALMLLVSFLVLYVLAIRNRRNAQLHMRFMLGAGLVFVIPAVVRIIGIYLQPAWFPPDDPPSAVQMILPEYTSLLLVQGITLALLLNDLRRGLSPRPWGWCLGLLVFCLAWFHWVPQQAWWADFGRWYLGLPLG